VYKDAADNPTVLSLAVTAVSASYSSLLFFPLDGLGWNAGAIPQTSKDCSGSVDRNFAFTSELHYTFTYDASSPAPTFQLTANDDYWVFVNRKLVIDKGGVKSSTSSSFTADSTFATLFDLVSGQSYSIDVFQAERATCSSNYEITFVGFQRLVSQCTKSG
jgi:fibro-slime domain-containing protein